MSHVRVIPFKILLRFAAKLELGEIAACFRKVHKMRDEDKTKEQLINELVEMRQRVAELVASETERVRAEEALREPLN